MPRGATAGRPVVAIRRGLASPATEPARLRCAHLHIARVAGQCPDVVVVFGENYVSALGHRDEEPVNSRASTSLLPQCSGACGDWLWHRLKHSAGLEQTIDTRVFGAPREALCQHHRVNDGRPEPGALEFCDEGCRVLVFVGETVNCTRVKQKPGHLAISAIGLLEALYEPLGVLHMLRRGLAHLLD